MFDLQTPVRINSISTYCSPSATKDYFLMLDRDLFKWSVGLHKFTFSFLLVSFHQIEATNDLENFDKERHEDFKKYEMTKEHERREHLKTLDEEARKKEEEHYEEMKKKHADHPKINHPVS